MSTNVQVLERHQRVELPLERVFEIYADAFNLERITPPWLNLRVISPRPIVMGVGTLIEYRLRLHRIPVNWLTRIDEWEPPHRFADRQLSGPYEVWHHTHTFEPDGEATVLTDRVRYRVGFGPLGRLALALFVRRDVERIFEHRAGAITALIAERADPPAAGSAAAP